MGSPVQQKLSTQVLGLLVCCFPTGDLGTSWSSLLCLVNLLKSDLWFPFFLLCVLEIHAKGICVLLRLSSLLYEWKEHLFFPHPLFLKMWVLDILGPRSCSSAAVRKSIVICLPRACILGARMYGRKVTRSPITIGVIINAGKKHERTPIFSTQTLQVSDD